MESVLRKCIGRCLLERLAKLAAVAVNARALNHENVGNPAHRVDPRNGAADAQLL
jgi:hypothetical protein